MSVFFTSDLHFGHKKIIEHEKRPFNSVTEMDNYLIKKWNKTVKENDKVYILGDFSFYDGAKTSEILKQLNGIKYLVKGNHDHFMNDKNFDNSLFEWIKDYHELKMSFNNETIRVILFHYPINFWRGRHKGYLHCFGHMHSNENERLMKVEPNSFNICIGANDLNLVSLETILSKRVKF